MSDDAVLEGLKGVLAQHDEIVLGYVFGSFGRGEAGEGSDIDVAVLSRAPLELLEQGRLLEELGRAIGFRRRIDLVDLRSAGPVLTAEVVRDGTLLLERDPLVRFDFETAAIRRFEDTRPLRRLQQDLLREGARGPA